MSNFSLVVKAKIGFISFCFVAWDCIWQERTENVWLKKNIRLCFSAFGSWDLKKKNMPETSSNFVLFIFNENLTLGGCENHKKGVGVGIAQG